MRITTDRVVIGSGFGGAVAAARLAESGADVLLLERGPWRETLPVQSMNIRDMAELPYRSWLWLLRNTVKTIRLMLQIRFLPVPGKMLCAACGSDKQLGMFWNGRTIGQ
jgi:flavin-dependent dehydrogenase